MIHIINHDTLLSHKFPLWVKSISIDQHRQYWPCIYLVCRLLTTFHYHKLLLVRICGLNEQKSNN